MKKIDLKKLIVLDIEVFKNCFVVCCRDYLSNKKKEFIFFNSKTYENQPFEFFQFLRSCIKNNYAFITFNGLGYDLQILDYFYDWCNAKVDPLYDLETSEITKLLYAESQRIIGLSEEERNLGGLKYENDLFIPTIDLFKQKHFDRPQKATSLKWVQFTMKYHTIEESPLSFDDPVAIADIPMILQYCWNDVDSTYEFFNRIKFETEVRLKLSAEYGRNLVNASEPRMAREIFGKFLCDDMGIEYADLKRMKTIRKELHLKDIIFPYIKFLTPELNKVLADVKNSVIDCNPHSKQTFSYNFASNGLQVYLGLGGIHACVPPGVYSPQDEEVIADLDVVSFYPKLGIENNVKPEHLGNVFANIYNNIFNQRQLIPKKDPKNYIFKILLNSAYGLSSEINSYFYDKKYTYTITINGQLTLLMLMEALFLGVPGIKLLQMNTDGLTVIYKKVHKERVAKICEWWKGVTKLTLEHAFYNRMVIMDVNNYIGVYADAAAEPKCKGLFETKIEYHKNPSYMVIPLALKEYFIKGTDVSEFIINYPSIFDFCGGVKKNKSFKLNLYKILNNPNKPEAGIDIKSILQEHGWVPYEGGSWIKGEWIGQEPYDRMAVSEEEAYKSVLYETRYERGLVEIVEEQQKVCRYIISKPGQNSGLLMKDFNDGRKVSVVANTLVEPLNVIKPEFEDPKLYNLNYDFYIKEAKKIIELIHPKVIQNTLF